MNFLKNKKILFVFILVFLLIYSSLCAYSYANIVFSDISDSVFRLHVIANSDSKEDQNLKYLVRDSIISYMNGLLTNISSKEDAIRIVSEHISDFQNIAQNVVYENGFNYSVSLEIRKLCLSY